MMSSSFRFAASHTFTVNVFDRLSVALQEVAQTAGRCLALTEANLPSFQLPIKLFIHRFVVVVSPGFSGLLLGKAAQSSSRLAETDTADVDQFVRGQSWEEQYYTSLEFEPDAIAAFLAELQQEFLATHPLQSQLAQALLQLQPNSPDLQAQFSLKLAEVLSNSCPLRPEISQPQYLPLGDTNQPEQGTVFSEMATQIRQTQELSLILQTAIQQVRTFLQVERVVIYEFETTLNSLNPDPLLPSVATSKVSVVCGRVTYEDRAHSAIPQILNLSEGIQCFIEVPEYQEKFRKGAIQAIEDVRTAYPDAPCLVNLLEWAHVQSKLVVPIVFREELWGLLIAHQCSSTRHWQEGEIRFLQCVAELLSIAIYQNQLYSQLQLQAQTLEQRVIERTQELRDAVNAAQSADLSKTEFLATISHELRTPLTAIIGMSTTLLRLPTDARREKFLPLEKQREYLRIIRTSGEHLLELINDIIDLSQVEAGRAILEVQEFSLSQAANECIRMLRDRAQQNQIQLNLDLQLTPPDSAASSNSQNGDRFTADPRRIKQILLNLLSNAIKFTPENGSVTLRVWTEAEAAIFQVEDTGIGIPDHQFALLFKKFQQLDRTYERRYEGTGLGLAITKQLVELHNGHIDVDSIVDKGSTFTVRIPAQPLKPLSLSEFDRPPLPPETLPGGRVVLIEDDETVANLICDLLNAAGHQVIWMIDSTTALAQIEIIKPEVVLIGTQLMGMSRGEVLHLLRQTPATRAVRILLLLNPEDAQGDRWLSQGANAYLTLPISYPEELLDKVRNLI
ncbi:MAG: ATP-binding protein [Leptolyngbyaceae cyanobacterium bins.302]|nr:ATP-binding protein [Leptolyngbyaceae cyanobacterium bins.302]